MSVLMNIDTVCGEVMQIATILDARMEKFELLTLLDVYVCTKI